MKRCTALLCLLVAVAGAASGQSPSIEATGDDIVVSIPASASLKVRTYDAQGRTVGTVAVVTQTDLDALKMTLEEIMDTKLQGLQAQIDAIKDVAPEARVKTLEDDVAAVSATLALKADANDVSEAGEEINALSDSQSRLDTAVKQVQQEITTLSGASEKTTACLGSLAEATSSASTCPKPTGTMCPAIKFALPGKMAGTGIRTGATRFFTCPETQSLVGSSLLICTDKGDGSGVWSAPVPTCADMVTCSFGIDDFTFAVFVDGKRVPYVGDSGYSAVKRITFPATVKVIAVKGGDNNNGCEGGGFAMRCTSVNKQWNGVKTNDRGWRAVRSKTLTANGKYPDGGWAAPSYDASAWQRAAKASACLNANALLNNVQSGLWKHGTDCSLEAVSVCGAETADEQGIGGRVYWWFRFNLDEN